MRVRWKCHSHSTCGNLKLDDFSSFLFFFIFTSVPLNAECGTTQRSTREGYWPDSHQAKIPKLCGGSLARCLNLYVVRGIQIRHLRQAVIGLPS